jgi:hypothetical protein
MGNAAYRAPGQAIDGGELFFYLRDFISREMCYGASPLN